MPDLTNRPPRVLPAALVAVGALVGLILQRTLVALLHRAAARTSWKGDEVIIESLGTMPFAWCLGAGLYAAARTQPMTPEQVVLFHRVVVSAAILSATVVFARIAAGLVRIRAEKSGSNLAAATGLVTTNVRVLVLVTGLLVLFQTLGVEITPILTTLGIGGLAVALALQDTLSNHFAGIYVVLSRRTRKGDYIKLDSGEEGYVTEITWRDQHLLKHEFVKRLHARYAQEGITIPFPRRTVEIVGGGAVAER